MTIYNAQKIEQLFTGVASLRISQKRGGDSRYTRDDGYWDGGRCDYGGKHNLKEDCQTLGRFFGDVAELKNARKELTKFNNEGEFNKNKKNLLDRANQALNGLQMKTGANTSVGGVCIIWDDFADYLNTIIDDFRKEVESLKNDIERVPYNEAKELQKLNLEERKLQKEIEENERKARNETDPDKKKKFLLLATEAKTKWKKVLERKKQLKSAHLGDNFNPDNHINDFLTALESKLSGRNRPPRNPSNPTDPDGGSGSRTDGDTHPQDPFQSNPNTPQNFFQDNKQLILIGGIALLVIFYLYSQQNQSKEQNYYDF